MNLLLQLITKNLLESTHHHFSYRRKFYHHFYRSYHHSYSLHLFISLCMDHHTFLIFCYAALHYASPPLKTHHYNAGKELTAIFYFHYVFYHYFPALKGVQLIYFCYSSPKIYWRVLTTISLTAVNSIIIFTGVIVIHTHSIYLYHYA